MNLIVYIGSKCGQEGERVKKSENFTDVTYGHSRTVPTVIVTLILTALLVNEIAKIPLQKFPRCSHRNNIMYAT